MSALPPKADMCSASGHVRFGPIADIACFIRTPRRPFLDAASPSLYIRKRGEGELAVRAAFENATLVRPAVMFGPDDAFLTTLLKLLSQLPLYPMFGRGLTKLQPAYVDDVAEAIVRTLKQIDGTFERGGPRVKLSRAQPA